MYNCGKVCLSLLNTWSGHGQEKWLPKESTMLQVLVSIQGLILNAKPYFNEPGYADLGGTKHGEEKSLEYNERTFMHSLRTMVYSMRRPPKVRRSDDWILFFVMSSCFSLCRCSTLRHMLRATSVSLRERSWYPVKPTWMELKWVVSWKGVFRMLTRVTRAARSISETTWLGTSPHWWTRLLKLGPRTAKSSFLYLKSRVATDEHPMLLPGLQTSTCRLTSNANSWVLLRNWFMLVDFTRYRAFLLMMVECLCFILTIKMCILVYIYHWWG